MLSGFSVGVGVGVLVGVAVAVGVCVAVAVGVEVSRRVGVEVVALFTATTDCGALVQAVSTRNTKPITPPRVMKRCIGLLNVVFTDPSPNPLRERARPASCSGAG